MKISEKTCVEFVNLLASKSAVPGGGGAAALVGAIGMALGSMVCNLTIGKKKYAEYEDRVKEILVKAGEIEEKLLSMIDEDANNFLPLSKAYGLPTSTEEEKKINIFLIEEPENHLHRSMQIALSHILFLDDKYQYLFMTTHSPYVLAEMDHVNLIRIYNEDKIVSRSVLYTVPTEFKSQRKMLNRGLVEAIFADKVLLVEGLSENVLFGKVLSEINPFYEADGIYILSVGGFGFRPYFEILDALEIDNIIKTDNDLRKIKDREKYSVLGFSRLNNYIGENLLPTEPIDESGVEAKRTLYDSNRETLDQIRKEHALYLSRCSLEEDLDEVLHDKMVEYIPQACGDVIGYLQEAKNNHMAELVEKLTAEDCKCIYEHYNFACLKEVML